MICSENAFKRQQAQVKGEVLNIPDVNSSLDGLFSAGLKFIQVSSYVGQIYWFGILIIFFIRFCCYLMFQEQHAYDYRRLALVRYEMLALTSPEFKLQDMVPNREFLVPTQLHDLFCWIHDHDPLDLLGNPWLIYDVAALFILTTVLGKPWDRYHLELQLLQDALKQARLDRRRW